MNNKITAIAFGGEGIFRQDGMVVFVPFTVPGDTISCRIVKQKKTFATGKLLEVIEPSPQRVAPSCPYYGTCGGCQLQHIAYPAQTEYKKHWVEEALTRIAKIANAIVQPTIPAQEQWHYRRHVTLNIKEFEGRLIAGYFNSDNTALVQIQTCPIFSEDTIIQTVQTIVKRFHASPDTQGRVSILKGEKYILHFSFEVTPKNAMDVCAQALKEFVSIQGIALSTSHQTQTFGNIEHSFSINDLQFCYNPHVFVQNHPEQSTKIYQKILEIAKKESIKKAIDLYCGIGVSTLLLAHAGAHVLGIEGNPESIRLAQHNAKINKITNVKFNIGDVKHNLQNFIRQQQPQLILVNPPRVGMDPEVVNILENSGVPHIIYISCMPATLARDLQKLCAKKYTLNYCQPYDMFPQTTHVETLVHLKAL